MRSAPASRKCATKRTISTRFSERTFSPANTSRPSRYAVRFSPTHTHMHTHAQAHTHVHARARAHTHTHTHRILMHTHTYAHAHTCTHTHTHAHTGDLDVRGSRRRDLQQGVVRDALHPEHAVAFLMLLPALPLLPDAPHLQAGARVWADGWVGVVSVCMRACVRACGWACVRLCESVCICAVSMLALWLCCTAVCTSGSCDVRHGSRV